MASLTAAITRSVLRVLRVRALVLIRKYANARLNARFFVPSVLCPDAEYFGERDVAYAGVTSGVDIILLFCVGQDLKCLDRVHEGAGVYI